MGVESDRLVFDYLSRVGDLAQTAMPAAQRMQLVAQLRSDIERERGSADTPAAVQRILGRIGSPDDVVEAASTSGGNRAAPVPERPSAPPPEPPPGSYGPYARPPSLSKSRPDPRARQGRDDDVGPDWLGGSMLGGGRPRMGDELTGLPGMTGEIFIPFDDEDLNEDDPLLGRAAARAADPAREAAGAAPAQDAAAVGGGRKRGLLPGLLRGKGGKGGGAAPGGGDGGGGGAGVRRWGSPVLLLAAVLLAAGAVIGSWIPLLLGWGIGYLSRQHSRTQAKVGVLGIPGAVAVGLLVWLWGRDAGKWSTPIAQGQMRQALVDALPVTVRIAAVGTALYLLWRARRSA